MVALISMITKVGRLSTASVDNDDDDDDYDEDVLIVTKCILQEEPTIIIIMIDAYTINTNTNP